ncbi:hypothetical protein O3M35_002055 [Rhynocoris fuscipes]|uniref:rRNA methyltransferase 2, mitochondrial n=1 Tax=Rhynocoris fuscipes TaxID=488301 RepID=A0AAW1CQL7_9HEMI
MIILSLIQKRWITVACYCRKAHINLKGKKKSSQDWLIRQLKDPYVEKAKINNYRCRSAFKLLEINEKYNLLYPGQCVIDCGAAPGSWTQVAVSKTNADGKVLDKPQGIVFAVDRLPLYPIEGAHIIGQTDLASESGIEKVTSALNGRQIDVLLSDVAPNATGIKEADHDAIIQIGYIIVRFGVKMSRIGSSLLIKIWDGRSAKQFADDISRFYSNVKRVKPQASRNDSSELYILAREFKGLNNC